MFSVKDIAALASKLFVPFFAAAFIADGVGAEIVDELPNQSALAALVLLSFFFAFVIYMAFVAFIDPIVVWLDSFLPETDLMSVMVLVGFFCIVIGLLGLSSVVPDLPKSPLNLYWHLGLLSYGFSLINRSGRL